MTWKVIEYIMSNIQSWAGNKSVTQKYQLKAGDSQSGSNGAPPHWR